MLPRSVPAIAVLADMNYTAFAILHELEDGFTAEAISCHRAGTVPVDNYVGYADEVAKLLTTRL